MIFQQESIYFTHVLINPWSLVPNIRNYINFCLLSTWTVVTDVTNELIDTFPKTVHNILNIEPHIENIVLHLYKTIQNMFLFIVNIQS